jgi:mevalonate kinase
MSLLQTPPFHKVPVRRGHFNHLALLAQQREQAKLGEQKDEVIARIDGDIRKILSEPGKVGTTIVAIMAQRDRTRGKVEKLLREVAELIEELAVMEGTLEWVSELGRSPYAPIYPCGLAHGVLNNLRERLMSSEFQ